MAIAWEVFGTGALLAFGLFPLALCGAFICARIHKGPKRDTSAHRAKILSRPATVMVWAPCIEEMLMRLPLVIFKDSPFEVQALAVLGLSSLFAFIHQKPVGTEGPNDALLVRWVVHGPWAIGLSFAFLSYCASHSALYAFGVVWVAHGVHNTIAYVVTACAVFDESIKKKRDVAP